MSTITDSLFNPQYLRSHFATSIPEYLINDKLADESVITVKQQI
jgi:hypothetical protein